MAFPRETETRTTPQPTLTAETETSQRATQWRLRVHRNAYCSTELRLTTEDLQAIVQQAFELADLTPVLWTAEDPAVTR